MVTLQNKSIPICKVPEGLSVPYTAICKGLWYTFQKSYQSPTKALTDPETDTDVDRFRIHEINWFFRTSAPDT